MNENKNENKKGYIIFNADGSQPEATLAAIDGSEYTQTIIDGKGTEILKLFGAIVQGLEKSGMPKTMLHSVVDTALLSGDLWGVIVKALDKKANKMRENGESIEGVQAIDISDLFTDLLGD